MNTLILKAKTNSILSLKYKKDLKWNFQYKISKNVNVVDNKKGWF